MRGLAVSVAAISALAGGAAAQNSTCADGLYMIIARGTGEAAGPGVSKLIGQEVEKRIPGSKFIGLDYPATFTDPDYDESEKQGAQEMKDTVLAYNKECPNHKIAVLGYSQGAQLSMDAFCGGRGEPFSEITAVPSNVVDSSVVAIVLLGDPSHNPNATYNRGTSKNPGIFGRDDGTVCEDYADLMASYCDTGDVYCDQGNDRTVHGHYLSVYGDKIVDFITSQYEKAAKTTSSISTPTPTPAPSGTGSSSGPAKSSDPPGSAASGLAPATGLMILAGLALMTALF